MEEGRCWMIANKEAKCEDYSWEERAFAEDAAGVLGGCVWPPRSYSCNFCRREFRSAQALGGHMNVHRRDRARLKQLAIPHHPKNPTYQNPPLKSHQSFSKKGQVSINDSSSSPMYVPRASVVSIHQTIYTPESKFVSSLVVNHDKNLTYLCLNNNDDNTSKQTPLKIRKQLKRSSSFTNLSGSTIGVNKEDVHDNIYKKRKLDTSATTPMPNIDLDHKPQIKLDIPNKEEIIDLELRLGDRPKIQ